MGNVKPCCAECRWCDRSWGYQCEIGVASIDDPYFDCCRNYAPTIEETDEYYDMSGKGSDMI